MLKMPCTCVLISFASVTWARDTILIKETGGDSARGSLETLYLLNWHVRGNTSLLLMVWSCQPVTPEIAEHVANIWRIAEWKDNST